MSMRAHIASHVAALFAFVLCAALPAQAQQPPPREQLKSTLQQLEKSKETEAEIKQRLDATNRELRSLQARATSLAKTLQESEARVTREELALEETNGELRSKRLEFEARQADYMTTIRSLLRMQTLPATAILTSPEDAETLMRTASVLEKTNAAVARKATALREDMAQLKSLQRTARERDARTRKEQETLNRERAALAQQLSQRQKLQASLSADHAEAEARVAELSRTSKSLQELVDSVTRDARKKRKTEPASEVPGAIAKKGALRNPVSGKILHRFGDKQEGAGTYRGMVFETRPGATVVAPHDGEVAFTGPFRDYGNMVLIKHAGGYISLIAGLGTVKASVDQRTVAGEPLGTMPESGKREAYVEFRGPDAKPIDPADWFANVTKTSAQR
jgi:septal ring factor EnvC (AmiA/AmiB activator)